ncbi:actin, plasmodial isoform, putative [Entamoeba invadens IP1]|uniref:actin, plasmodial isoform, putative n=1 Tax=Entamoeba invadens IP1 TaxID=370355 RepID=UPI0002C3DD30|nr:actin, plasmodial isoform, putative [Entamoeba invadens IP1]ELP93927.1 actin, plasmodial isoform, putative [Entamoeba invadens IP1]|eukprot:XP_004260698.1 actin, plasmodial isoform, putative [Entamoeba invadens IP1]
MEEDCCTIVFDNGSYSTRAGFAGDEAPRSYFPTVVGYSKLDNRCCVANALFDFNTGRVDHNLYNLIYPIHDGVITNFDEMEKIWETHFNDLFVNPKEKGVLLSESPNNNGAARVKTSHVMFETFQVPSLCFALQELFGLCITGRTRGVVLDCGLSSSHCLSFDDGKCIEKSLTTLRIGGEKIDEYLLTMLNENTITQFTTIDKETARDIKERKGYVVLDYNEKIQQVEHQKYTLPDGRVLDLGNELFKCTEAFFMPFVVNSEEIGVHEAVYNSVLKCDKKTQQYLYENVVLSGAANLFAGFENRLSKELKTIAPQNRIRVDAMMERKFGNWMGALSLLY